MSSKYSQKLVDSTRKSAADAVKTVSKRAIRKTAEATGDLIGNKIANKITSIPKKNLQRSYIQKNCHQMKLIMKYQKYIYISPQERQQIIDELRLI